MIIATDAFFYYGLKREACLQKYAANIKNVVFMKRQGTTNNKINATKVIILLSDTRYESLN